MTLTTCFSTFSALEVCRGAQAAKQSGTWLRDRTPLFERPMSEGSFYVVDSERGSDDGPGSKGRSWPTISRPLTHVEAGDTLCLREGSCEDRFA